MRKRQSFSLAGKLSWLCASIMGILGLALVVAWSGYRSELVRLAGGNSPAAAVYLIVAGAAIAGIMVYGFLNRYVKQPMRAVEITAARVEAGDVDARVRITRPKEFTELAASFNRMIDGVVRAQVKADIDQLTGLFNYRHAYAYLKTQIGLAQRYKRDLTIAMFDIDHLKEINDLYGRPAGDKVLKSAAEYIKSQLRQVDYVARYGGEEFLIVLPETPPAPAMTVIERVQRGFSDKVFIERGEGKSPVFVSAGVADFPRSGEDEVNLAAAAGVALLLAKRRGRNQVAYFRVPDQKAG
ncbi:MAG: sensor domain-containing diguanylate cyclase [Actinomycetota bacterium]|nr:sensor domain-containing diguanylate cyclase [Actinomycetota bacterium]